MLARGVHHERLANEIARVDNADRVGLVEWELAAASAEARTAGRGALGHESSDSERGPRDDGDNAPQRPGSSSPER
jgi:hypothetical protein